MVDSNRSYYPPSTEKNFASVTPSHQNRVDTRGVTGGVQGGNFLRAPTFLPSRGAPTILTKKTNFAPFFNYPETAGHTKDDISYACVWDKKGTVNNIGVSHKAYSKDFANL